MNKKFLLIKRIYLYIVSFVGLMFVVISLANLFYVTLRTYVFTQADYSYYEMARPIDCNSPKVDNNNTSTQKTEAQCTADEEKRQEWDEKRVQAQRHNDFARDIAFLIVGIPLFLIHWKYARKREKDEE